MSLDRFTSCGTLQAERIPRSNLIGVGVLPLQFAPGDSAHCLGLTGEETYSIRGLADLPGEITVQAEGPAGTRRFTARVPPDTPTEADYDRHGGILPHALRALLPT